jgi:hypothetical protein
MCVVLAFYLLCSAGEPPCSQPDFNMSVASDTEAATEAASSKQLVPRRFTGKEWDTAVQKLCTSFTSGSLQLQQLDEVREKVRTEEKKMAMGQHCYMVCLFFVEACLRVKLGQPLTEGRSPVPSKQTMKLAFKVAADVDDEEVAEVIQPAMQQAAEQIIEPAIREAKKKMQQKDQEEGKEEREGEPDGQTAQPAEAAPQPWDGENSQLKADNVLKWLSQTRKIKDKQESAFDAVQSQCQSHTHTRACTHRWMFSTLYSPLPLCLHVCPYSYL